jgi:hypothetical protein
MSIPSSQDWFICNCIWMEMLAELWMVQIGLILGEKRVWNEAKCRSGGDVGVRSKVLDKTWVESGPLECHFLQIRGEPLAIFFSCPKKLLDGLGSNFLDDDTSAWTAPCALSKLVPCLSLWGFWIGIAGFFESIYY